MKIHELKTLPGYYNDIIDGRKTFEVRFNDRCFAVGDILHLRAWENGVYQGDDRECLVKVDYLCNLDAVMSAVMSPDYPLFVGMVIRIVTITDKDGNKEYI